MKKVATLLIISVFLLSMINVPNAKSGTVPNMPVGAVTTKFFNLTNIPTPQQINYFNKVFSLSSNLSGKMVVGSDNSPMLAVFQVGSGKLDWYKWNGSQWVYQYSLSNIVPGFEEPQTLSSYKYVTWNDYTQHTVNTGNSNPVNPSSSIAVTISGPTTGVTDTPYTYTATISGGTPPYNLTWSNDGFVSQSGVSATYKWLSSNITTTTNKTISVYVTDAFGLSGTGSLNVQVSPPVDIVGPDTNVLYSYYSGNGYYYNFTNNQPYQIMIFGYNYTINYLKVGNLTFTNPNDILMLDQVASQKIGGHVYVISFILYIYKFSNLQLGTVPIEVSVTFNNTGSTVVTNKNFNIFYGIVPKFNVNINTKISYVYTTKVLTITAAAQMIQVIQQNPLQLKVTTATLDIPVETSFDDMPSLWAAVTKDPTLASEIQNVFNNSRAKVQTAIISSNVDINSQGSYTVAMQAINTAQQQLQTQVGNTQAFTSPVWNTKTWETIGAVAAITAPNGYGGNKAVPIQKTSTVSSQPGIADGTIKVEQYGNQILDWKIFSSIYGGGSTPLQTGNSITFPDGSPFALQWLNNNTPNTFNTTFTLQNPDNTYQSYQVQGWIFDNNGYDLKVITQNGFSFPQQIPLQFDASGYTWRLNPTKIFVDNANYNNFLSDGTYLMSSVHFPPASQVKLSDIPNFINTIQNINFTTTPTIIKLLQTPSSLVFNDTNPQTVIVQYLENDGTYVTPDGSDDGYVKDSSGKNIAYWTRNKQIVTVYPISSGSGNIVIPSSSLGGPSYLPYSATDVNIPITVNVNLGSLSVSINGKDILSLGNKYWLQSPAINPSDPNSVAYAFEIDQVSYSSSSLKYYMAGRLTSYNVDWITPYTPVYYGVYDYSGSYFTPDSAINSVSMYGLNVVINTTGSIKARFTISGDGLNPTTVYTSMDFTNSSLLKNWVAQNLSSLTSYNRSSYKSLNYSVEISFDNGTSWLVLKSGQDFVQFVRTY